MDSIEISALIDNRIAELTAIRDTMDKQDRHYYAVSAGLYELLLLQQKITKLFQ